MASFVISGINKAAIGETFSIAGNSNIAFRVYLDSECRIEVSRGSFEDPAIVYIRRDQKERIYCGKTQLFIRNESACPITKIKVRVLQQGKPASVAIAPDCSGKPKSFRFVGQPTTVFEGLLMPMQVIGFWLLGLKGRTDQEGFDDLVLVIDAETAVLA